MRIVLMLSLTATASYICRVNVSTAGPLLMKEFGLSQVLMGRVFSAFLLGYALFQIPAGMLADRWGAKRTLSMAAWLWIILSVLQVLVGWGPFMTTAGAALLAFMISRFLLGVAEAPTFPGSAQGVSKWVIPRQQGSANGLVIAAVGLGSAIAPVLVSQVMVRWGWRPAILVSILPALAVAMVWPRVKEPMPQDKQVTPNQDTLSPQPGRQKSRLRSPSFIFLTISYSLQGYVGYIFVSWFYLYLVQERHFDLIRGGWWSSLPWVLSILSIPLGGMASDALVRGMGEKWGRRIVPLTGMGLSGVLISIGAHTHNPILAAISLAFATAFVLCVEGPFWATMMKISGRQSGTAGGIMNMGSNTGGFISPALTPIIAVAVGWENALHLAAILAVVAALLWLGINPSAGENEAIARKESGKLKNSVQ